jgi:site-specific DNA-methyltransferase (adenine-specific)
MLPHNVIHGDCEQELKKINDNYFDLIIADPPYWKVINEKWDYQWKTEADYLIWSEKWLKEVFRVLRIGGSFYLFGYFRMLCLLVPYLQDFGFEIRQQIIVDKGIKAVAGRATKNYKIFPNTTESILLLIKDNKPYAKKVLLEQQRKLKLSSKYINEALGVKSNGGGMWSIYTGENICEQFPTKELWEKLGEILEFYIPYESIAQTFNPIMGLNDVWSDIDFYKEQRIHPTQKPLKLISRLVAASSNVYDKVLDPFGGSGSTVIACNDLQRIATVIEIDEEYIQGINFRISEELCQLQFA